MVYDDSASYKVISEKQNECDARFQEEYFYNLCVKSIDGGVCTPHRSRDGYTCGCGEGWKGTGFRADFDDEIKRRRSLPFDLTMFDQSPASSEWVNYVKASTNYKSRECCALSSPTPLVFTTSISGVTEGNENEGCIDIQTPVASLINPTTKIRRCRCQTMVEKFPLPPEEELCGKQEAVSSYPASTCALHNT